MNLKNNIKIFCSAFLFFALFALNVIPLYAQDGSESTLLSFGMKEMESTNKALSRGAALKECLMDAVKQYSGQIVSSKLLQANDGILKKKIYENYNLFLKNYRINEEKEEDGYYKITAEVRIKTSLLTEKLHSLGMLQKTQDKPKLLVLISDSESGGAETIDSSWWVNDIKGQSSKFAVHKLLENRLAFMGFALIEKSTFLSSLNDAKVSLQKRIIRGNIDTIRKFRFRDVLISGSTNLSVESDRSSPKTLSIAVSTYNLRNGRALSKISKTYNLSYIENKLKNKKENTSINNIIQNAVDDFSAELIVSFLNEWYDSGINTTTVQISVKDIYSYQDYNEFKKLLSELKPDITKAKDALMQKGVYGWELEITSTAKAVAQKISNKKIGNKTIKVLTVSRKKILVGLR